MATQSAYVFPHLTKPAASVEARQFFLLRVYGTLFLQTIFTMFFVQFIRHLHYSGSNPVFLMFEQIIAESSGNTVDVTAASSLVLTGFGSNLYFFGRFGPLIFLSLLIFFRQT